eukprot:246781_1
MRIPSPPPDPNDLQNGVTAIQVEIDQTIHQQLQYDISKAKKSRTRNLFICYLFMCLFWGFLAPLPGSLFSELQKQLHISDISVTQLFLSRAITFCAGSIVTAYIIDKFISTHHYVSLVFCVALVSVSLVPFITYIPIQYLLWISMGFTGGLIEVSLPVYAFRTFTDSAQTIWFVLLTCYGVAKTVTPLAIQLSITLFDTFAYALFLMSAAALCASIFLFILATPQHDKLRTMNKQIAQTGTHRSAESVLMELEEHRTMRNMIIILFAVVLILFFFIQVGLITFVAVYIGEYLHASEVIGRYLISTYYGAQLLYRFMIGFCLCDCLQEAMHSTNYLFAVLMIGYAIEVALFMMWILCTIFTDAMNVNVTVAILFIVFAGTGFLSSATYPTVFELCETIYPIDGSVSCVFTMAMGVGDLLMVVIMAQIIKHFHIGFQPIPLAIAAGIEIILLLIIRVMYNKYKSYESVILATKKRDSKRLSAASLHRISASFHIVDFQSSTTQNLPTVHEDK